MQEAVSRYFNTMKFVTRASKAAAVELDKRLGARFNCFDWIAPSEMTISKLIREFLDADGSHGQGDIYLRLFLEHFSKQFSSITPLKASVSTEVPTKSLSRPRRIDILIDFGAAIGGIAIENKPRAVEQDDQLDDYIDHMKSTYGSHIEIIYLNGTGSPPQTIDRHKGLVSDGRFLEVKYNQADEIVEGGDLLKWLEACALHTNAPKVREFLFDFINWIKERFDAE